MNVSSSDEPQRWILESAFRCQINHEPGHGSSSVVTGVREVEPRKNGRISEM
jgi:hypothetical protein